MDTYSGAVHCNSQLSSFLSNYWCELPRVTSTLLSDAAFAEQLLICT